jgi:hypothetical protein
VISFAAARLFLTSQLAGDYDKGTVDEVAEVDEKHYIRAVLARAAHGDRELRLLASLVAGLSVEEAAERIHLSRKHAEQLRR